MSGPFVWFDLVVGDDDMVGEFYSDLLGWTVTPGPADYRGWVTEGEQPWAGIIAGDAATAGRWLPYVVVDDLDAAAKRAVPLGGTVVRDKKVGPAGTSLTVADPSGALVALFTPAAAG